MRTLHHFILSPQSRKIRLALGEKRLDYTPVAHLPWALAEDFWHLNPAEELPVLVEEDGLILADSVAIAEYLEEAYRNICLLPTNIQERAEARRLAQWFDIKFDREVTSLLLGEKILRRILEHSSPDTGNIRAARNNLNGHLGYLEHLAERRNWLGGDLFSIADLAAGAQLSVVDYLGDVDWNRYPAVKEWYQKLKSRPSFRPLLGDLMPGFAPPRHYNDLDF